MDKDKIVNKMLKDISEDIYENEKFRCKNDKYKDDDEYYVIKKKEFYSYNENNVIYKKINKIDRYYKIVKDKRGTINLYWCLARYKLIRVNTITNEENWEPAFQRLLNLIKEDKEYEYFDFRNIIFVFRDNGKFYVLLNKNYIKLFIDLINEVKMLYFCKTGIIAKKESERTLGIPFINCPDF